MSDQTYTIAELLALPDDALNVLAAELRGWHAKYFIDEAGFWCGGGKILYAVVIGSLTHEDWPGDPQGITRPHWSPADDRNQSGELLTFGSLAVLRDALIDKPDFNHNWSINGDFVFIRRLWE